MAKVSRRSSDRPAPFRQRDPPHTSARHGEQRLENRSHPALNSAIRLRKSLAGTKGFVHLRGFAATADLIVSASHPPDRWNVFASEGGWLGVWDDFPSSDL
jgi:hypothetical protein